MKHRWIFVPPAGLYESEYRCRWCGDINIESCDNPDSKNPVDGCDRHLLEVPTCIKCGGQEILMDAYAKWSHETNEWILNSTHEHTVCETCGGECTWEMRTMLTPCNHIFVSADNPVVSGASICTKCKLVVPTNDLHLYSNDTSFIT